MQISVRASAVRTALERATGSVALVAVGDGRLRFTAPVPICVTAERWAAILLALDSADEWGSHTTDGRTVVWAITREDS